MRKFIAALALVITSIAVASPSWAIDDPQFANYQIKRGTGGRQSDASREVRLVRYSVRGTPTSSQTRDLVSNDLVVWDTISDDGVSVRMTSSSADGAIAGVVCSSTILTADNAQNNAIEALGGRNWGWVVVSGLTTVRLAPGGGLNGVSVGQPFVTSIDTGAATGFESLTADTTADVSRNARVAAATGGFFFDTPTVGDTSVEVYVQLN